jgi:phospholipid transport system substrate-binding protein
MVHNDRLGPGYWVGLIAAAVTSGLINFAPAVAALSEQQPMEAIKGTIAQLYSILEEYPATPTEARRWEIEQVIRQRVFYQDMAKRSIGTSWSQLDDLARQEYVGLFVQLLRDSLANRMVDYSGQRISYLSERRESGCAEIKTSLVGNKVDTFIDFRLTNIDGEWLIYDAIIDGASLVGSYRAQFARIIRDTSSAHLMARLKEQTLIVKLFESGS